jgi:single-stranded-DNA-specific exonuclease
MLPAYRWRERPSSRKGNVPGFGPLLSTVLSSRGFADEASARGFIDVPEFQPETLVDVEVAAARIRRARVGHEHVMVHGDYDVDGITSAAIITKTLQQLGIDGSWWIPHRERDGYGLSEGAVKEARQRGASLMIAVDCGTTDFDAIEKASSQGIDVLVFDHHTVSDSLPAASAIVNPKRLDAGGCYMDYSAAGVAYQVAHFLLGDEAHSLVDLAALGTVADVMPLTGMNRRIVKDGLGLMARDPRLGLRALIQAARLKEPLTARDLAFMVAPRLNAAGRMGEALRAFELLVTDSASDATRLAFELDRENQNRQFKEKEMFKEALEMTGEAGFPVAVFAKENWQRGLLGLVAGKMCEALGIPVAMLAIEGDVAQGSARSTPDFDMYAALKRSEDALVRFGGHRRACGLEVNTADIPLLRGSLRLRSQGYLPQAPEIEFDCFVTPEQMTTAAVAELDLLEPYGEGNPRPLFVLREQVITSTRVFSDGKHLRIGLLSGVEGVMWDGGAEEKHLPRGPVDILAEPRLNNWDGKTQIQLFVRDIRPSGRSPEGRPVDAAVPATVVTPVSLPEVDAEVLGKYLSISGRAISYIGETDIPSPARTATDYIVTRPPRDPVALRQALAKTASGSRIMCVFKEAAFADFEKKSAALAPDRDTLVKCHRLLLQAGTNGVSIDEYARRIEVGLSLDGGVALTLARSSATIFTELGFAQTRGLRLFVVAPAARRELTDSEYLRDARASLESLQLVLDKTGRSPSLLAEWLAGWIELT